MACIWGGCPNKESLATQRKRARMWGYLAVAGTFLLYVYYHLGIPLHF
jgi:hypothetical protein